MWSRSLLTLTVALVVFSPAVPNGQTPAQTAGGAVAGTVRDESGAVLPGVTITLTREGTPAVSRTTISDDEGRFRFEQIAPGFYRVNADLTGFRTARLTTTVGSTEAMTIDIILKVGGVTETIAVSGGQSPGLAVVPVFYATDREQLMSGPLNYGPRRNSSGTLFLGRFDVSIPRYHEMGNVERPTIWRLRIENPDRHFVITKRRQQPYDGFYEDVRATVRKATKKDAFVFIHGFNVEFEDAVFRTAQIAYDLGFDGAPILYSWPSLNSLTPVGYTTDSESSSWTIPHLRWFLEDVAAKSGATRVHLIAHSMGNKALVNALDRMAQSSTKKFSQIVLTAPDIDADIFMQLADAVRQRGDKVTLYASANDKALEASKAFHSYRRAGDTSSGVVVAPGIDTVDVSQIDSDLVGHFYYGDNDSVISDIFLLLTQGLPPSQRPRLRPVGEIPNQFWRFAP